MRLVLGLCWTSSFLVWEPRSGCLLLGLINYTPERRRGRWAQGRFREHDRGMISFVLAYVYEDGKVRCSFQLHSFKGLLLSLSFSLSASPNSTSSTCASVMADTLDCQHRWLFRPSRAQMRWKCSEAEFHMHSFSMMYETI